jgi:hypothetical protein
MKYGHFVFQLAGLILGGLALTSCGSGGSSDGGTTPSVASPTQTIVSGTVQAPGGQLAFYREKSLRDVFVSEAYAATTALVPVLDGTTVEVGRISSFAPFSFSLITSTVTAGGRYSFNFTNLGLTPAVDLVVRVRNGATEMRAFVTGLTVDLSPMTEVAFQRSTLQLGNASLNQYTIQELADITGAISLLVNLQNHNFTAQNMAQTLMAISGVVQGSSSITNFVISAASPGQTAQGPGDLGSYYPLSQGNQWNYQGVVSNNGGTPVAFQNSATISGTKLVNGIPTLIYLESNPENEGTPEEDYITKNGTGIVLHGNNRADDSLTPVIVPLQRIHFPLHPGITITTVDKKGLPFGQDLDGDAINDVVDIQSEYAVMAIETLTITAGTFQNSVRIDEKTVGVFHSSAFGTTATITSNETLWVAPSVGMIKRMEVTQSDGFVQNTSQVVTEELSESIVNGLGIGGVAATRVLTLATNDLVYDKVSKRIYASVPGNPGTIQPIDPETLTLDPSISVGNGPNRLALSDDGQYLYVGLDGEAAVQRVHIPTRTAGPKFALPTEQFNAGCGPLTAEDIAVIPGNALSIAVSRYQFGCIAHRGVTILDSGIPRALSTSGIDRNAQIEFSESPTILYGYDAHSSDHGIRTMNVVPQGLTVIDVTPNVFGTNEIRFGAGRIFEQFGKVFDPKSKSVVGALGPFGPIVSVFPDSALGKVFSVVYPQSGTVFIQANDISTLQVLGSSRVEGSLSLSGGPGVSLIRWGTQGLAFRTLPDKVVIVRSSLVQ